GAKNSVGQGRGDHRPVGAARGVCGHQETVDAQGVGQGRGVTGPVGQGTAGDRCGTAVAGPIGRDDPQTGSGEPFLMVHQVPPAHGRAVEEQHRCALRITDVGESDLAPLDPEDGVLHVLHRPFAPWHGCALPTRTMSVLGPISPEPWVCRRRVEPHPLVAHESYDTHGAPEGRGAAVLSRTWNTPAGGCSNVVLVYTENEQPSLADVTDAF